MAQLPAYAVNGGAVPAEMLRRALWLPTHGESGVAGINDLKVTQLPTAGAAVSIAAGGAVASTRVTGAHAQESYMLAQDSSATLPISETGTFYVIARIDDWHFTGNPAPADPENYIYWGFAVVSTLTGITYPYVPLARVARGTATNITSAMITDLRRVAMPRRERTLFAHNLISADGAQELVSTAPQYWPSSTVLDEWEVYVPAWATRAMIVASVNGVRCNPASGKYGVWYARLGRPAGYGQGNVETQHQKWDLANSATGREHWELADDINIPTALRDTTQPLRILGYKMDSLSGSGPVLDSASSVKYDIEFVEARA